MKEGGGREGERSQIGRPECSDRNIGGRADKNGDERHLSGGKKRQQPGSGRRKTTINETTPSQLNSRFGWAALHRASSYRMPKSFASAASSGGSSPLTTSEPSSTTKYSADETSLAHAKRVSRHLAVNASLLWYATMNETRGCACRGGASWPPRASDRACGRTHAPAEASAALSATHVGT
eukprot:3797155-Pleurochrysis_carterae.AAC.2